MPPLNQHSEPPPPPPAFTLFLVFIIIIIIFIYLFNFFCGRKINILALVYVKKNSGRAHAENK